MAGQARESQVFFRLQVKAHSREAVTPVASPDPRPTPRVADGDPTTLLALRAAERARALASGDVDLQANDTSEQTRKLSFLKSGPETEVYNPHGLQKPVRPTGCWRHHHRRQFGQRPELDLPGSSPGDGECLAQSPAGISFPQGSRLVAEDNVVALSRERALVVWRRVILPDGSSVVIDNLPATDTGGYAGHPIRSTCTPGSCSRASPWQLSSASAASSPSVPPTAISSRRCSNRPRQPPIVPANAWSNAISTCSRPSACGRAGRCA